MTQLKMLSTDEKLAEIRRLYFQTTKPTIQGDLAKALDLLKSMNSEDERERATVYMEGMAQMMKDWGLAKGGSGKGKSKKEKGSNRSKSGAELSGGMRLGIEGVSLSCGQILNSGRVRRRNCAGLNRRVKKLLLPSASSRVRVLATIIACRNSRSDARQNSY